MEHMIQDKLATSFLLPDSMAKQSDALCEHCLPRLSRGPGCYKSLGACQNDTSDLGANSFPQSTTGKAPSSLERQMKHVRMLPVTWGLIHFPSQLLASPHLA